MSRASSTPAGFRNLRVLIPEDLHWRLRDLAHQSRMSFHKYILARLSEAIPLNEDAGPSDRRPLPNPSPCNENGPGPLRGPSCSHPRAHGFPGDPAAPSPQEAKAPINQRSSIPEVGRQAAPYSPSKAPTETRS